MYAFDQLRAIMMMLGLVVHVSTTYLVRELGAQWPVKDPLNTSLVFDMTVGFIHTFRMPLFFVVSGFFTSMLFFERGGRAMLVNRLKRIVYPFIVGMVILYPAWLLAVNYFRLGEGHEIKPVFEIIRTELQPGFGNLETIHLWFLYYLAMYCFAGWAVASCASKFFPKTNQSIKTYFTLAFRLKWAPFVFAPVTFLFLALTKTMFIDAGIDLFLNVSCFFNHGYFFFFGWLLYLNQDYLSRFLERDKLFIGIGVVLFFIELGMLVLYPSLEKTNVLYFYSACNSITAWCFTFGFTGMSIRYLNKYSVIGRYVSDASYWVYLMHLPLIVYLQSMLVQLDLNPLIKFVIVISSTALILFVSYNYLVRDTFIGEFLSGKRFKRGLPED